MALTEDIAWLGQLLDTYGAHEPQRGVASNGPQDSGVPVEMQVGPVNADGWVEWRVLPSTLNEADVTQLENKFSMQFIAATIRAWFEAP